MCGHSGGTSQLLNPQWPYANGGVHLKEPARKESAGRIQWGSWEGDFEGKAICKKSFVTGVLLLLLDSEVRVTFRRPAACLIMAFTLTFDLVDQCPSTVNILCCKSVANAHADSYFSSTSLPSMILLRLSSTDPQRLHVRAITPLSFGCQ